MLIYNNVNTYCLLADKSTCDMETSDTRKNIRDTTWGIS